MTYDGALDPLGATQVVPYVCGLARRGVALTLVSFEKPARLAERAALQATAARLQAAGVGWRALRYHRRPRLPATFFDLLNGARVLRQAVTAMRRRLGVPTPVLVHARGDVPLALARAAHLPRDVRLVYEVRGLFADERVEVGSWRAGSWLDRLVRAVERGNLQRADGLLAVMAPPGLEALRARREPLPPHRELPNSVDLARFTPRDPDQPAEFGLAYHGSLGGWYPTRELVAFARLARTSVPGRVLFLTPQPELAWQAGADPAWAEVRSVAPEDVPTWLRRARASFFLIQPSPAKRASSPTKFAEALACGLPVAANAASGELGDILPTQRVGAVIEAFDETAYARAAQTLADLLADSYTSARCRALAERRYGLEAAVTAYHDLYLELLAR